MKRFCTFPIPQDAKGGVAAIGNFDGVHLGHQAILDQVKEIAGSGSHTPTGVVTFEPHPRKYFSALKGIEHPPFRLMDADTRANQLEKLGLDHVYEIPFSKALSNLTPIAFCKDIISQALGLSHVVVGADFKFGNARSGDISTLKNLGKELGFDVTVANLEKLGDDTISSTNIRKSLSECAPRKAAKMLGHWHRLEGAVLHGEKRGRELGYPTANMDLSNRHMPAYGIYAVIVDVLTGPHIGRYHGAASIGVRPMFGENTPNCETFIFDFNGDLYGETLSIGLVDYLRGEEKFDSLQTLITQMDADCVRARHILDNL